MLKLDNKRAQEDTQRLQEQIWTIGGRLRQHRFAGQEDTCTIWTPPAATFHCSCVHLCAGQLPSRQGELVHAMLGVMYSAAANFCS